jgi:RNA polymerase sigma factor (sigma-70 family)
MQRQYLHGAEEPLRSSDAQYRYEVLTQCPRLSDEQYQQEARRIRLARAGLLCSQDGEDAKQRVVQGYLWLVRALAYRWASRTNSGIDVLDLIQAGNIALIVAVDQFSHEDRQREYAGHALVKYLCKRIVGAIIQTIYETGFSMRLPLKKDLQEQEWDILRQPARGLDECDEMGIPVCETLLAPELILSSDPEECPPHKASFLALLLAELPFRQRQVLQLRYGLGEDRQCSTPAEIAAHLGLVERVIRYHEQQARQNIQAIYRAYEQETGRSSASLDYDEDMHAYLERRRMERAQVLDPRTVIVNAKVAQAFTQMQERGERITGDTLAHVAGVGEATALRFLRQRGYSTHHQRLQDVGEHLERTFVQMQQRGEHITQRTLAQVADVHENVVRRFLQQRGYHALHLHQQATTERLEHAFAAMQEQGRSISIPGLKDAAGVSQYAAARFLKEKRPRPRSRLKGEKS